MPKIARIASMVAFVLAAGVAASALRGPIILLPAALIPLAGGIGVARRRVWSAYGMALYFAAQLLLIPVIWVRAADRGASLAGVLPAGIVAVILIPTFLFAGRALSAAGGRRGYAWPWVALSALSVVPLLFVQAFVIPSGAMENTILAGDRIFVQRFPAPQPREGEIVAFHSPLNRREIFVKRIVGVPGDHIRISAKALYRNGVLLPEPYSIHKTTYVDSYRDNFPSESNAPLPGAAMDMLREHVVNGEVVVPDGEYFVLGDNRDNSLDSRYFGFISADDLIGRPVLIYDSEEPAGDASSTNSSLRGRARWNRLFKRL